MHTQTDPLDWLKLALTPGIGPANFSQLLRRFETPGGVLGASEASLHQIPRLKKEVCRQILKTQRGSRDDAAKKEFERMHTAGIRMLTSHDPLYPRRLHHIPAPPPLLFYRGEIDPQGSHAFGIVGTRRCDSYGLRQTRRFAGELASAGLIIVSGLALGIDTAAHRGAISAGGKTWAFLPGGFDRIYPPENRDLLEEIVENGAVLTERTLDAVPRKNSFPARNRLVSGVSVGVLVVQAPPRSGALITAVQAMEQSRDVFALPGRVDEPGSLGPHQLIRDGAKIAISPEEILGELNLNLDGIPAPSIPVPPMRKDPKDRVEEESGTEGKEVPKETRKVSDLVRSLTDPNDRKIVLRLEQGAVHIDRISADLGVEVKTISERLLLLEMQGVVKRLPGMFFDLVF